MNVPSSQSAHDQIGQNGNSLVPHSQSAYEIGQSTHQHQQALHQQLQLRCQERKEKTDAQNNNCSVLLSTNEPLCHGTLLSSITGGLSQLLTPKPERPTTLSTDTNRISRRNVSYGGDQCKYWM